MITSLIAGIILMNIGLIGFIYQLANEINYHLIWIVICLILGMALTYACFRPVIM